MASRDATFDLVARDKTSTGIRSVEGNLKRVAKTADGITGQLGKATEQWGRGFSRVGAAASRWANSGDTVGKKFARGIGAGVGKLADLGGSIGGGLSKAVNSAGPQVAVAVSAVLVGAALAAAPAVAGAIVGGAGLGGVVGGLILASKDARVAGALDSLKQDIGRDLTDAAKRFVPATLGAVQEARSAFRGLLPDLRRIFDTSATWVAPLTRSLGKAAQAALTGITQAVVKAGPIIGAIGRGIEGIGQAVGKVFGDLADNGNSMALALNGAFVLTKSLILGVGSALNLLVEGFEFFVSKIPGGKRLLDSMAASQTGANSSALNLASGFQALGSDANSAANGITRLKEKSDELADSNLSLREAQIAAKNSVSEATAAIKENGKAKGFNTQKGRENEAALNAMATAFNNEATAGDRSGRSANDASNAYHNNRAALVKMAEKAGYSTTQANKLAAQLLKIPKNVNTNINADTAAAMGRLATFQKAVNGLKGKTVTVRVQSNGDHYIPGVGTQLKLAAAGSWSPGDGGGTQRTGGPRTPDVTLTNNLYLDGRLIDSRIDRAVNSSERRTAFRNKVGRR